MDNILMMGRGKVAFPILDKETGHYDEVKWLEFKLVAVTTFGVVMYMDEDNHLHVSNGIDATVEQPEWSIFDCLADLAAEKEMGSEPKCSRCNGDDAIVAQMSPPVCPMCYRGRPQRPKRQDMN